MTREQVELDCPAALVFDAQGRLLVVAHADNRILAIQKDGHVVTVAGHGPPGTATDDGDLGGDGGPAREATLQEPVEMAFDSGGDLYFSDRDNHAVRRIDTHGIITTVAGTGDPGYRGDGGPATKARIERPQGLVVTADGTLYFSDGDNAYVRRVDPAGTITTIAGKGTKNPIDPETLLLDAHGGLLVSDTSSIRRMTTGGRLTTIAGKPNPDAQGDEPCTGIGGRATDAVLTPSSLAVGPHGDVFIGTNTCGVLRLGSDGVLSQYVPAAS
jgi:serine/threonine-protein kinase